MAKPMTWSEKLVGRRLPPEPKYIDTIMAGYVKSDGAFCCRMEPGDRWLRPAWAKIRRSGWVKASVLSFGKGATIFCLTDRGEAEAVAARERVTLAREARNQWSRDFVAAHKVSGAAA